MSHREGTLCHGCRGLDRSWPRTIRLAYLPLYAHNKSSRKLLKYASIISIEIYPPHSLSVMQTLAAQLKHVCLGALLDMIEGIIKPSAGFASQNWHRITNLPA